MTGHYRCDHVNDSGVVCGAAFADVKGLRTHAKSHRTRLCRWCQRAISVNGHTQHESSCDEQPHAFPWQVLDDLLTDLVIHATEIPDGTFCVVSVSRGARFMTPHAAVQAAMLSPETTVIIPSGIIPPPGKTVRWRRKELHDTRADKETSIDDRPRPQPQPPGNSSPDRGGGGDDQLLFGVNWPTVR